MAETPSFLQWLIGGAGGTGALAVAIRYIPKILPSKSQEVKVLGETIGILSGQLEKTDERVGKLAEGLEKCEAHHQECEEGRQKDREAHRKEIDGLRGEIAQMLRDGVVAEYAPTDLRRVPPRPKAKPKARPKARAKRKAPAHG